MADDKAHRSMSDFDFFDSETKPVTDEELASLDVPEGLEEQIARYRREQRSTSRSLLLMIATLGVCIWFLSDYRHEMAYAFSTTAEPSVLGNVTDMTPADVPVNQWIQLTGITEHRGLTQKKVRGFSFMRDEFWYFRLVGSQGVFIEVPQDAERYGIGTRLTVQGRAIDPAANNTYRQLVAFYYDRYVSIERPQLRVIQVGYAPGDGRWPFIGAFAFLALLTLSNLLVLKKLLRQRKRTSRQVLVGG